MNTFTPIAEMTVPLLVGIAGILVLLGWGNRSVAVAWAACIFGVGAAEWTLWDEPGGLRTLGLVFILLLGMKAVVHAYYAERLSFGRYLAFALLWLGMRPRVFATQARLAWKRMLLEGSGCFIVGLGLIQIGNLWIGLAGLSLMLHFGFMAMASGGWRLLGVPANRLFRNPLKATTLPEFWSRRWNLGYVEMIAVAVFRPVRDRFGKKAGLVAAFAFSGLLHEVAISLPVHAGYGLPMLYFVIQAGLLSLEAKFEIRSRLWVLAGLLLPVGLLFHEAFLENVIEPALANLNIVGL